MVSEKYIVTNLINQKFVEFKCMYELPNWTSDIKKAQIFDTMNDVNEVMEAENAEYEYGDEPMLFQVIKVYTIDYD